MYRVRLHDKDGFKTIKILYGACECDALIEDRSHTDESIKTITIEHLERNFDIYPQTHEYMKGL